MKTKEIYSNRKFLNKGTYHSLAAVSAIMDKDIKEDFNWTPYNIEFHISDCSRVISLDMDCNNLEDLENSIFKMQQVEDVARGLKEAMIKEKPALKEWLDKKELKEKEDEQEKTE